GGGSWGGWVRRSSRTVAVGRRWVRSRRAPLSWSSRGVQERVVLGVGDDRLAAEAPSGIGAPEVEHEAAVVRAPPELLRLVGGYDEGVLGHGGRGGPVVG